MRTALGAIPLALLIALGLLGGRALAAGPEPTEGPVAPPGGPPAAAAAINVDGAPSLGPPVAPVTIVEFSDFRCPYCAQGSKTLRRLLQAYPGQVRWVFKHFPLISHPDAPLAHQAAEAAGEQGKFWEMHELLFRAQRPITRQEVLRLAAELQLDTAAFSMALRSPQLRERIARDVAGGRQLGVGATPTYFVNGTKVVGTRSLLEFRRLVEGELRRAAPPLAPEPKGQEPSPPAPEPKGQEPSPSG